MSACASCGAETTGAFCSSCGAAVTHDEPGAVDAVAPPESAAPLVAPAPPAPPVAQAPLAPSSPPPAPAWAEPPAVPAPAPYATWLRRVGGSLIDGVIFGIPFAILFGIGLGWGISSLHLTCVDNASGTGQVCHSQPGSHFSAGGVVFILLAVLWVIAWYIYVVLAIGGDKGATVGMQAVKVRCVRDATFTKVGNGASFGRLAITWVFSVIWFVGVIDNLFPLWDAKRQTLHDKVVSTVVLYEGGGS